jgi:putative transposase
MRFTTFRNCMERRRTYDTRVKYLVRAGLLPDVYRKQIHRSLISKWKREDPEKYYGYELNESVDELYEVLKNVANNELIQKTVRNVYRINKILKDCIGSGREYVYKLKEQKTRIVRVIQSSKDSIGINKARKLFGITKSTFRTWAMEEFFHCNHAVTKLCNNAYPQQLTIKEIHKMHRMLVHEKFLHWPIVSLAYYAMRKSIVKAHPNTWYKYAKLMKIKRRRKRKFIPKYEEGLRAQFPNEKWHADITLFQTADGATSYIFLVVDNFSRCIISWRVASTKSAKIRLETFIEAIDKAGILPKIVAKKQTDLIVDGGKENNNEAVETFIEKYPIEKLVALRDIEKSNSIVEAVNRIIKYDYLYPRQIQNQSQLIAIMENVVIPDYNNKRPHGSLKGLTPFEAYSQVKLNYKKIREKMIKVHRDRICYNKTYSCLGCPFDCKNRN